MNVDFLESDNQNCLDLTVTNVSIRDLVPPEQTSIRNISECEQATFQSLTVPALLNPTLGPALNVTTQNLVANNIHTQTLQTNDLTINQVTTSNAVINKLYTGTQIVQTVQTPSYLDPINSLLTFCSDNRGTITTINTVLTVTALTLGIIAFATIGVLSAGFAFAAAPLVAGAIAAEVVPVVAGVSVAAVTVSGSTAGVVAGFVGVAGFTGALVTLADGNGDSPGQAYGLLSKLLPSLINTLTLGSSDPTDLESAYIDFCKIIYRTISSKYIPSLISYNPLINAFDDGTAYNNVGAILSICTNNVNSQRTLRFQTNGDLAIYSSANPTVQLWHTNTQISDMRLKRDLEPIIEPMRKLSTLDGVFYNYKDSIYGPVNERQVGLIAQQVIEEFPEAVFSAGSVNGVYLEVLVPVLIESIKELNAEFEALHARYNALIEYY